MDINKFKLIKDEFTQRPSMYSSLLGFGSVGKNSVFNSKLSQVGKTGGDNKIEETKRLYNDNNRITRSMIHFFNERNAFKGKTIRGRTG